MYRVCATIIIKDQGIIYQKNYWKDRKEGSALPPYLKGSANILYTLSYTKEYSDSKEASTCTDMTYAYKLLHTQAHI